MKFFHDNSPDFLSPALPVSGSPITIKARTDVPAEVYLCWSEELFDLTVNRYERVKMEQIGRERGLFYYAATLMLTERSVKYHFAAVVDGEEKLFGIDAFFPEETTVSKTRDFLLVPDFDTPEWSKGALWYQIMPDSFHNGDPFNDKPTSGGVFENGWGASHWRGEDYFGGDLKGVIEKLDYLRSFGVTAISINPIWIATHQAGYGADDLTEVDPCFGGDLALIRLREETQKRGMKLCLDGVFDYAVSKSKYYNAEGLYPFPGGVHEGDPCYDLFLRDKAGNVIGSLWSHPLFDFSKDEYRKFVYEGEDSVVKTYLRPPYSIDGWRMDVGNIYEGSDPEHFGSSVDIMRGMREAIKSVGADRLLITENDLPKMRALAVNDSKWNYELGVPLRSFAAGKISAREMVKEAELNTRVLPRPVADACFNHVTTHDTERIMDTAGGKENAAFAATLFMLSFVGAPSLYFGDEYAACGRPYPAMGLAAPTSFGSMDWEAAERGGRMADLYRLFGRERAKDPAFFAVAGHEFIYADDELFAFVRALGEKYALVIVNRTDEERTLALDLSAYAATDELCDLLSGAKVTLEEGRATFPVYPGGAYFVRGGRAERIDGFGADGAAKCGQNTYELCGGSLFGEGYRWFSLSVDLLDARAVRLFFGGLELCVSHEKLQTGQQIYPLNGAKTLTVMRNREIAVFADGRWLCAFPADLPARVAWKVCGEGKVGLSLEQLAAPLDLGLSDGFFEERTAQEGEMLHGERLTGRAGYGDLTFCAVCRGEGGLIVAQGESALTFGFEEGRLRLKLCGVPLAETSPDGIERLQLERQGARWSACYEKDGKWEYLARRVHCNFSDQKIGVYARGDCAFRRFQIGDGKECRKDYHDNLFSLSTDNYSSALPPARYRVQGGEFRYVYGGIEHIGGEMTCSLSLTDFKAIFTLKTDFASEEEYAEVRFGEDRLRIFGTRAELTSGGRERAVDGPSDGEYILCETLGKLFVLKDGALLFETERDPRSCKLLFGGTGRFRLMGLSVYADAPEWFMARGKIAAMREGLDLSSEFVQYACAYALLPLKNFCFSANIKFNVSAATYPDGYFSLNYAADAGGYPEREGVAVRFYKAGGKVEILSGGKPVFQGSVPGLDNESFYLVLTALDGILSLYVAPNEREKECRLVAKLDTGVKEGGCLIFTDRNARSFLCAPHVFAIAEEKDAEEELRAVRVAPSKHRYMI